jgi:hypothetical protein
LLYNTWCDAANDVYFHSIVVDFVELLRDFDSTPPVRRTRGVSIQITSPDKAAHDQGRARHMSIIDIGHSPEYKSGFIDFEEYSRRDDKGSRSPRSTV